MSGRSVGVDVPAQQLPARETRRISHARWVVPAALALAAVVLFLCYLRLSSTTVLNSDGADQALQAWDMLHGNWLLRGWTLGDVSYYTTEVPEYMVVEMIRGLGPGVIHVAAAVTYTLLVLLAGWLAKGRATGKEGVLRALIGSGILLAPQLGDGAQLLLSQPDHLGTQVPLLVIFLVLDRAPRRWYTPAAIAVMLTWVLVADQVAVFDAALPLVAVGGLRACRAFVRHRKPLASQWFELSLVAAGIVSYGVSQLVVLVLKHMGGYTSLPLRSGFAAMGQMPSHIKLTAEGILILYGAHFHGLSPGSAAAFAAVHLAGAALALWAFCRALRRFFSTSDLIVPVIAAGIMLNLAAYTPSLKDSTWFSTREITAVLPFGAVLAGRLLAEPLAARWLRPMLAGVLACYAIALGYGAAQHPLASREQPVVGWLEAHHLSTGLGTYAQGNLTTLESGGRVAVRTVTWLRTGAVPRAYESTAFWYDPRLSYANFVLMKSRSNSSLAHRVSLIPYREIVALAGRPAHTYHYKTYTIMVWNHNLLADLGGPPTAWPGRLG
jgi:hypothetical protein